MEVFFSKTLPLLFYQHFTNFFFYTLAKFSALFFILPKYYIFLDIKISYYSLTRLRRSKIIIVTNKIIMMTNNTNVM